MRIRPIVAGMARSAGDDAPVGQPRRGGAGLTASGSGRDATAAPEGGSGRVHGPRPRSRPRRRGPRTAGAAAARCLANAASSSCVVSAACARAQVEAARSLARLLRRSLATACSALTTLARCMMAVARVLAVRRERRRWAATTHRTSAIATMSSSAILPLRRAPSPQSEPAIWKRDSARVLDAVSVTTLQGRSLIHI